MYWNGKGTSRFIRPIRWLVALLGDDVIPFEIEGVSTGDDDAGASHSGCSGRYGHDR